MGSPAALPVPPPCPGLGARPWMRPTEEEQAGGVVGMDEMSIRKRAALGRAWLSTHRGCQPQGFARQLCGVCKRGSGPLHASRGARAEDACDTALTSEGHRGEAHCLESHWFRHCSPGSAAFELHRVGWVEKGGARLESRTWDSQAEASLSCKSRSYPREKERQSNKTPHCVDRS